MIKVVTCLTQQHDLPIVSLAVLISIAASYMATALLNRGARASGSARWLWLGASGTSGGFGIWGTHFVAMLAYHPPVVVGYDLSLTILSLAIATCTTLTAALAAVAFVRRFGSVLAGLIFGLGIACMHFTGMLAVDFPGRLTWDSKGVLASVIIGTALSVVAFQFASNAGDRTKLIVSSIALASSVLAMHFTAMAAVTFVSEPTMVRGSVSLSYDLMILVVVIVSLSLLASVLSTAMFAIMSERRTLELKQNFRLLVQGITDYAIYMLDARGRITNWNAGAERSTGYRAEEIIGKSFAIFYSDDDRRDGAPDRALETAQSQGKFEGQGVRHRKDGSTYWAYSILEVLNDDSGNFIGYASINKDITQRKIDSDRLATATRNLDIALENMAQGICLFDKDERLVVANRHYSEIFHFPEGFVQPGMAYLKIVEGGFRANGFENWKEKACEHYERRMASVRSGGGKAVLVCHDGTSLQEICTALPDGGWIATFEDITERVRTDEQISFMAKHDVLTGLPNRLQFSEYLTEKILVARRTNTRLAVIGIDLDNFKEINDRHGHVGGDKVLMELAIRVSTVIRGEEMVARFGGDEFAAVKRFGDITELHDFIDRLEGCLHGRIDVDGIDVKIGASLGVALYPQDATAADSLVANADMALYRAKLSLVQHVCFYEAAMDEAARDRRDLANDLWGATGRKEMYLHYQIQKSVSTGETTGYEALLRWRHPTRGNIGPADFIPLAEQCGAILPIGEWVLMEACRAAVAWGLPYRIAVNLSPVQLGNADMARVILKVLLETGLEPCRLEIEITESAIITDKDRALQTLRQIKHLGVKVAIDDFGTGYSSLETLRAFPFDKIKLDKSFMNEVETSSQSKAIVRAIMTLGQGLGMSVLAEGVETQAQLDILAQEKCDEAQGYLLGKPAPIEDLGRFKGRAA